MKKILLLLLLFSTTTLYAQDVIVKKDGSTILCKVLEIGTSEVKYKKHSNLDGPLYRILKTDIQNINYENGEKDTFGSKTISVNSSPTVQHEVKSYQRPIEQPVEQNMTHAEQIDNSGFILKTGFGLSSVVGSNADTDVIFSYKVGGAYEFWPSDYVGVIPEMDFVAKGFKSSESIYMYYLQVPVFVAGRIPVSDTFFITIKAGPYAAYGLFGSDVEQTEYNGYGIIRRKTNVFDSDYGLERFDAGIIGGISFNIDQYMIGFEYSHGLTKLKSNHSAFNQAFGVVFGYKF